MKRHVIIADMKEQTTPSVKPVRARFISTTKGVRPRPDQIPALEFLLELDAELDWSKVVRRGLDLFFAEQAARLPEWIFQAGRPIPELIRQLRRGQVFRSISTALSEPLMNTAPATGNSHKTVLQAGKQKQSARRRDSR